MVNAAAVRQPLAEAATRLRVDREVARIMGEGVRRIPPAADPIGERGVHLRRRCVDRGGVSYEKAGGGAFNHLAAQWRGEDREKDRKGHNIRSHHLVPLSLESSSVQPTLAIWPPKVRGIL